MTISSPRKKINRELLAALSGAALFGAAIAALSGQFVWALIAALGFRALAYVAQNLTIAFPTRITLGHRTTLVGSETGGRSNSLENSSDWLQKWNEDMDYCPTYKGTPGNIWNGPSGLATTDISRYFFFIPFSHRIYCPKWRLQRRSLGFRHYVCHPPRHC